VILSPEEIQVTIERLAAEIAQAYRGQPLLLVGVLKGAICLTADLARALGRQPDGPNEIMVDYVCVERYGAAGSAGGAPRLAMDCTLPVRGQNLLLADAIADNGVTLAFLKNHFRGRGTSTLRTCVLFDKPARREVEVAIDFRGVTVPNVFAIGYGLDYKEVYRNLPYLAELREGQTV